MSSLKKEGLGSGTTCPATSLLLSSLPPCLVMSPAHLLPPPTIDLLVAAATPLLYARPPWPLWQGGRRAQLHTIP